MVIPFKREAERVHFLVAAPAVFFTRDSHAGAEGSAGFVRELSVDRDWDIRYAAAEEAFANPEATMNRVIIHGVGLGGEPRGMSQDSEALTFGGRCQNSIWLKRASAKGSVTYTSIDGSSIELGPSDIGMRL